MNANLKKIDHIVVLMMENRSFDNMPDISQVLTLKKPRNDCPVITPLPCPCSSSSSEDKLLSDFQRNIVELLGARLSIEVPALETVGEAFAFMSKVRPYLD